MLFYILLLFIIIVLYFAYGPIKEFQRFCRMMKIFPGRKVYPVVGDAYNFTTESDQIFSEFRIYNKLFPKIYKLRALWYAVVSVNSPEYAEVVLSNVRYIKKSILYTVLTPWLKTGLLTSTGEKWFHRRKLLTPAFHFNILRRLTENFEEHNEYLLEKLKAESYKDKTNVVPIISEVALNIICGTSMGVSLKKNDKTSKEYRQAIYSFVEIFNTRVIQILIVYDWIFRLHPLYKKQQKLLRILHSFTLKIIKKREENFDENEFDDGDETYMKKKLAMLDLLLFAKRNKGEIDDEGIREEVDTFIFEGHDTVSSAISFALMLIANHKEHQRKIIQELDDIFGETNRAINFQDLQNMQYMELCLKECLRLYPSVPFISRDAEDDIPLDDKYTIPRGAIVYIHIYDIHRHKDHFPDPDKFDPERFLPENSKNRHPYAYIPFSAGPRNCIGQKYAMLEMKSIVATILRNYELEPIDTPETITLCLELVLRSKHGIHVKFVPRNK